MKFSKQNIALFITLLFHISGLIGILFSPYKDWFVHNTPVNLLLMLGLIIYTQLQKNYSFFAFAIIAFATGMLTEIIGVNTGKLFGHYSYSSTMGYKIYGVPLLIGVQWFVTVFCCSMVVQQLHIWLEEKYATQGLNMSVKMQTASLIVDGALLATTLDFIMEPVAINLGFWKWQNNEIPFYNYLCWFIISLCLMVVFKLLKLKQVNDFAIHLLLIQALFFLILRTFL